MSTTSTLIRDLLINIQQIYEEALSFEQKFKAHIAKVHPSHRLSASNLAHYLALRQHDLRKLQEKLRHLGVSRLGQVERHVLANLQMLLKNLSALLYESPPLLSLHSPAVSYNQGLKLLNANSRDLLGHEPPNRRVRIMVTLPTAAATDGSLVEQFLSAGMNIARINCAHDNPKAWEQMIENIRLAERKLGKNCPVFMDLEGPKVRTGPLKRGAAVVHIKPETDLFGRLKRPAVVWMGTKRPVHLNKKAVFIPLDRYDPSYYRKDRLLYLTDARNKKVIFKVEEVSPGGLKAVVEEEAYVVNDIPLFTAEGEHQNILATIRGIEGKPSDLRLKIGDRLILHKEATAGERASYDVSGQLIQAAHIACKPPEILDDLKEGQVVSFDDGKLEGIVRETTVNSVEVEITYAKTKGSRLKAEKGINFPALAPHFGGLTEADRRALEFVVRHADVVNMSFVNEARDVEELLEELRGLGADDIGLCLKIETLRAFENLPQILFSGLQNRLLGVMIARGDLAVECGWNRLAEVQEEILLLAEAAHVPNIWATQVLENLAKKGQPSRAEISDAVMAQRAECVMLNKGPYILSAIRMLDEILSSMQRHQQKKAFVLPSLKGRIAL